MPCCSLSACSPAATATTRLTAMRATHPSAGLAALVLILALVGAGSKAGVVPLHAWLPLAHPAAPSHVSALMSGVMTKVAVYGFIRIVFDLLGTARLVVEHGRARRRRHHRGDGRALCADAARSQAPARLSHGGEHRHHLYRARPRAGVQGAWHAFGRGAGADRRPVPCVQPFASSRACCSSAPAPCSIQRAKATWSISAGSSTACRRRLSCFSSAASRSRRCRRSTASCRNGSRSRPSCSARNCRRGD